MRHITWLTALLCLLCACGMESASEADAVPQASAQNRRLLLVIHGGGDDPTDWADDFIVQVAPTLPNADMWASYAVDWSADAEDRTSASRKGLRLGEAIGEALNERDARYDHVVIVAHSVGSFVSHGLTTTLAESDDAPFIHAIYFDPFTLRGVLRWGYGDRQFGEGADLAESYLNTDDGAPSTNDPLDQAHNIDVTRLRPKEVEEDRWHWWPIDAWLGLESDDAGRHIIERAVEGEDLHDTFERGTTRVL